MNLKRLLAGEQRAFLRRSRTEWDAHLAHCRDFFGEALAQADPERPVLIVGAGTGLEVPWSLAPPQTVGWDADPWSRLGTALRHRRFPRWVFADVTGGFEALRATLQRALILPGDALRRRPADLAARRLAGLLPSLQPDAASLRGWLRNQQPGTILVANVLGQLGAVAERLIEEAFRPASPWVADPEQPDPLLEATEAWTRRAVQAVTGAVAESGASAWMIHDRAVMHGSQTNTLSLGPFEDPWPRQLQSPAPLEASDPLLGLDLRTYFPDRRVMKAQRWLWPVGPGQLHLMEALAWEGSSAHPVPEPPSAI